MPQKFSGRVIGTQRFASYLTRYSGSWNERNTRDLIRKASVRLGLQIDQVALDGAMPYLDARHILVHRDGVTDQQYRNDYPLIPCNGDKLAVDYAFVSEAKRAVSALALDIDGKIVGADLVRRQDMHGQR